MYVYQYIVYAWFCPNPRAFNDSLLKLFADITKCDLIVNNLVLRAKYHGLTSAAAGVWLVVHMYMGKAEVG